MITNEELKNSHVRALQALAKAKRVECNKMKNGYKYMRLENGTYVLRKTRD